MAASVYATPPPDLSGEDTALSDVSNSSQTNSSHNSQSKKRALSATSFLSTSTSPSVTTTCTTIVPDGSSESKKRRKQTTPIRISATVGNGDSSVYLDQDVKPKDLGAKEDSVGDDFEPAISVLGAEEAIKMFQRREEELRQDEEKSQESIKKEMLEWDGEIKRKYPTKPEEWLQLAGLPFSFPPEAANYLPQLPLLGVPPVPPFNGDGSQRSNMPRIFNPEAYCDLCNKEFCNKYFLKTHKANKHGIYEPPVSSADLPQVNLSQIQISQLLFQQQQQQSPQTAPQEAPFEPSVYCDICLKKFSNAQSMRKHRSKVHEKAMEKEEGEVFVRMPEGFREDYSVEQEDVSFTPQPRRLSPGSIQQARDANFSADKLKRLGVINPEAFCELCGKEYCNKYFLRTHKLKRHGIPPPPDETKEERPLWHTIQTSPLNLSGVLRQVKDEAKESPEPESPKSPAPSDSDAISMDLQKLQSMIMQLNDLNAAQRAVSCVICNKELENHYMLHSHMLSEHSLENNNKDESPEAEPKVVEPKREVSPPAREGFVTPERPQQAPPQERRPPYSMTPTSSYCEICNKELCNKYFMKTHMQRMHGIEIENGAQIGGVVCNICNKELCSKYFLRVHKHNTHGIVEEGSPLPQSRAHNGDSLDGDSFGGGTGPEKTQAPEAADSSPKWLKAHLLSDHGKQGGSEKLKEQQNSFVKPMSPALKIPNGGFDHAPSLLPKPALSLFENGSYNNGPSSSGMKGYQCSYCSFSTPILPFLFIHERSHQSLALASESAVSLAKDRFDTPPTSTSASTPLTAPPQPIKSPDLGILSEMANLTQRPAVYALPQESGPFVMQSFFVEEKSEDSRFVPVIVFLPVKERVLSPLSVSFTLTPA